VVISGPLDQTVTMNEFVGPGMMPGDNQGPSNSGPQGGFMGQGNDLISQPRSSPEYLPLPPGKTAQLLCR